MSQEHSYKLSENLSGLPSCRFDSTVTDADSVSEGKAFSRKSIIKSFVASRKFGAITHTKKKDTSALEEDLC